MKPPPGYLKRVFFGHFSGLDGSVKRASIDFLPPVSPSVSEALWPDIIRIFLPEVSEFFLGKVCTV